MEPRHDSIRSLQRAARLGAARDEAHFQLLRLGEAVHGPTARLRRLLRSVPTRRLAVGTTVGAVLLAVVLTATAIAERHGSGETGGVRTVAPNPAGTQADETITGTAGSDRLDGRGGDDVVMSAGGDDVVSGSTGDDVLHGGAGDDVLWAGPGRDVLLGADGDDELHAPNVDEKVDRLHCGPGVDTAWVVSVDGRVQDRTYGCERVIVIEVRRVRRAAG